MRLLLSLVLILFVSNADAKARKRPLLNYSIGGSYKSIMAFQSLRHEGVFRENGNYFTEQRLRVQVELSRGPWRVEFADQLSLFSQNANPASIPLPGDRPPPAWAARQHPVDKESLDIINQIDRAYVEYKNRAYEVRVGKQVIAAGVGKIFHAISQTPRQPFVIVNPEYPITEDALVIQSKGSWNFEGRILPKTPLDKGASFHLVARGRQSGYDFGLTAGRSNDKAFVGLETAGNMGDSLLRAEIVGYQTENRGAFGQALIGIDRYFSDWSIQGELFYNGFGESKKEDYSILTQEHRPTPYQGKLYFGTSVDWTIHPLIESKFATIFNINDLSILVHLSVSYSLSKNFELMAGQFLGVGGSQSEFSGTQVVGPGLRLGLPDMTYLLLKFYF